MQTPTTPVIYYKTRLAPTPSGYLHLGNVLSFAITATIAKKTSAKILLRIDDLDRARANKSYIQDIFDTLNFLGIPWDEGPKSPGEFEKDFSQLNRMGLYNEALDQLASEKLVYACTCSRTKLSANFCNCKGKKILLSTANVSWRLISNEMKDISVTVYDRSIIAATLPPEMQNFVVKKKDGFPAYQLTSVIDDIFYGVDLIIRGEDLWPSTMAQLELARALGKDEFQNSVFYHHPLLMEEPGRKLSKSAGSTSIKYLRESGKSVADIYKLIGSMLGIKAQIHSWQQLGEGAINLT